MYTGSGKDSTAMFENGPKEGGREQVDAVQKEVKQLEIESERQRQSKNMKVSGSSPNHH